MTYRSPKGSDKGVDILAAPALLGFGRPRLCVQAKTGDTPVDRPTLDQLIGVIQNFNAEQGLLVSWGGLKSSVDKEIPVIIMTAYGTIEAATEAIQKGGFDFITKPFKKEQIIFTIEKAMKWLRVQRENKMLKEKLKFGS